MNFCHKCQSHYEKPGTCNCFAEKQPPVYVPYPVYPTIPTYPTYPWYPNTSPWIPIQPLITWETTCSDSITLTSTDIARLEAQGLLTYTDGSEA